MNWKAFIENLPAGVAILDENFNVVLVNSRISEKTGLVAESIKNPIQTVHPEDVPKAFDVFRKIEMGKEDEVPYPILLRVVKKDGYQWNEIRWKVLDVDGKKYYIIVFTDVTERVEMQKRIESLLEYVKLLNTILRHDIMNVFTTLTSYAELLEERYDRKFLEKMQEAISKGVELIKKIRELEISSEEMQPFELKKVIEEVAKGYDLEVVVKGNGTVYANEGIYSVFDNLIGNSVKHGGARRVEIEVKTADKIYVIYQDDGRGIQAENRDRIFERGFSTSTSSGMGLFIVRKLMESYGGDISLEDSEKGARFVLVFPNTNSPVLKS